MIGTTREQLCVKTQICHCTFVSINIKYKLIRNTHFSMCCYKKKTKHKSRSTHSFINFFIKVFFAS